MYPKQITFCLLLILSVPLIPFHVHAEEANQIASVSKNIFLNTSLTLPYVGGEACYYQDFPINIWKGSEIFGTIRSSSEIFFFIMTDMQFKLADQKCMHFATSSNVLAAGAITSYTFQWIAQENDKYHFILLNRSSSDVSISVTFWT